jgi:glucose-6-phosphate-specific signal transduction histidine kinase
MGDGSMRQSISHPQLETRKEKRIMKWKNMPISHKIATIISCLAVVVWLIQNVKNDLFPIDLTYPAIAVFTVCEAVIYWKQKRTWSYLLIAGAVVSMAFFILELSLL